MAKRTDKAQHLEPVFVEFIPERLEPGRLYVSMEYGAVAHLCACGCGSKVSTPLTPTDWDLKYNGKAVTLNPSIGSWSLPCRSHYFITANRIRWAEAWSDEQVRLNRASDKRVKQEYYEADDVTSPKPDIDSPPESTPPEPMRRSKVMTWLRKWWPW